MKRVTVIIEVLILVSLAGCGKSKEETIVGRWELLEAEQTLDFYEDGTVMVMEEGEAIPLGEYELTGENKVKISSLQRGMISGTISASWDEMSLTNLFGKIEKYGKVERIEKITKSAVAGNYVRVMKMPGEEVFEWPGILTLIEDGSERIDMYGQWQASDKLDLRPNQFSGTVHAGQIRAETLYQEPPAISLTKQRGAKVIAELGKGNILWSNYSYTGDAWNRPTVTLEIKEDGTFKKIEFIKDAWRIRDGEVEITIVGENKEKKRVKAEIDGYTIVFRKDDGTEFRYIRRSKQFLSRLEAPPRSKP